MKKTKIIQPRGKWVLVLPASAETKENEYGLLAPANVESEQKAQGTVEAFGSEVTDLKVGDTVVYGAYSGELLKVRENGKEIEYKLILEEDVIAFIK